MPPAAAGISGSTTSRRCVVTVRGRKRSRSGSWEGQLRYAARVTRSVDRRLLLFVSVAGMLACPLDPDSNEVPEYEIETFALDEGMPTFNLTLDACSSAPRLWVKVAADVQLPDGAVVGVTLVHAGEVATGFADGTHEIRRASATMRDVNCETPISVQLERLDGDLRGVVTGVVVLEADAQGRDGSTELEVRE